MEYHSCMVGVVADLMSNHLMEDVVIVVVVTRLGSFVLASGEDVHRRRGRQAYDPTLPHHSHGLCWRCENNAGIQLAWQVTLPCIMTVHVVY